MEFRKKLIYLLTIIGLSILILLIQYFFNFKQKTLVIVLLGFALISTVERETILLNLGKKLSKNARTLSAIGSILCIILIFLSANVMVALSLLILSGVLGAFAEPLMKKE